LFMLHAAPVHAIDKTTEIPVLIAESVDARGIQPPPPPIISAVVNLLAEETGLNLVIRPYGARVMAEQGEGLLYGAANTPERLPFFKFTKPVYDANQWLVYRQRRRWCSTAGKTCRQSDLDRRRRQVRPEFERGATNCSRSSRTTPPPKTA
jgi:hypothetical protein